MKRSFRTKRIFTVVALAIALALPLSANARPGGHGGLERQIEQLELDSETQASVDHILDESRTQRRAMGRDLRAAREQMHQLFASADSDEASLLATAERISSLELRMNKRRIATHLQLGAILTSEQMETLAGDAAERHGRPGRCLRK